MKKNLLKDLVLPGFWLFFFIVTPGTNEEQRNPLLLKKDNTNSKLVKMKPDIFRAENIDQIDINTYYNTTTFINASYFYRF